MKCVCCRIADVDGRGWRRSGDAVASADSVRVELSGVSMSVSALVVQVDDLSVCMYLRIRSVDGALKMTDIKMADHQNCRT